jgi:WD40 repeat protein/serine/threonine protein kinase
MTIDTKDVNARLVQVGPLGRKRGRLFSTIHCRYADERKEVVVKVLLRAYGDAEQAAAVSAQEVIFMAMEAQAKATRSPAPDAELRSPRPLHFLYYTTTKVTDRAVYLERPFVQYSLAERLQIRPFLDTHRRLFLIYQLFMAVHELHNEFGLSHGDLKLENVLLSSNGWLYITDVAPYKPVRVESFNPANFEFFFDGAESRVCTLAPERFTDELADMHVSPPRDSTNGNGIAVDVQIPIPTTSPVSSPKPPVGTSSSSTAPSPTARPVLVPLKTVREEAEVFSAACIAAFMLTDEPLFRLSHVLELRTKATYHEQQQYVRENLANYPNLSKAAKVFLEECLIGFEEGMDVPTVDSESASPTAPHAKPAPSTDLDIATPVEAESPSMAASPQEDEPQLGASPATIGEQSPALPVAGPSSSPRPILVGTVVPNVLHLKAAEALERFSGTLFPRYFPMLHRNILPTLQSLPPELLVHMVCTRLYDIVDAAVRCEWDADFAKSMARTASEHREMVQTQLSSAARARARAASPSAAAASAEASVPKLDGDATDDEDDDNAPHVTADRRRAIQAEVLDHVAPIFMNAMRFLIEDTFVKALGAVEIIGAMCSEECRRDVLLPTVINIVQVTNKPAVTPSVRAAALRAVAAVCANIRVIPASECFIYEEYVLPAVSAAAKIAATPASRNSIALACALAETVPSLLRSALYMVEQRQGLGRAYQSRLDFDSQRDAVVSRGWEIFKPLLTHQNSSVLVTALKQVQLLLPVLGYELVADGYLPLLTTHLGHPAVEVRREMVAAAALVAVYLKHSIANSVATIVLILEEALREKDARCVYLGLEAIRAVTARKLLTSAQTTKLVHQAIGLMAHPSAWVASAAASLIATAARTLEPVDVLVHLAAPLKAILRECVPLALLDRMDPQHVVNPAARLAVADTRRRIQCCADYNRAHSHPTSIAVPPGASPAKLEAVVRLDGFDLTPRECVWLTKALGLDGAVQASAHVRVPFLRKAPSVPWHMHQFSPTPRQLKRVLWQFKLHKRSVAATARSKMRRGILAATNPNAAANSPPQQPSPSSGPTAGTASFSAIVAAASRTRIPAKPVGLPLATTVNAHDGGVTAMTSARHWLVTAGRDNIVRLWDMQEPLKPSSVHLLSSQPFKNIFGTHPDEVSSPILFTHFASEDPQSLVAVGNARGQMRLFDIAAGKAPITVALDSDEAGGLSACVSLDPKVLIVGSYRGGLYAVDTRTPSREVWTSHVPRNRGPISCMTTIAADAPFGIACGTLRGYVALFDMRFRTQMASTSLPQNAAIYDLVSVASGTDTNAPSLAVATSHLDVIRLNASTFQETMAFKPAVPNSVRCLCTSGAGASLFTGGSDGLIRHWNLGIPENSRTLTPPPARSPEYNFSRGALVIAETPQGSAVNSPVTPMGVEIPPNTRNHRDNVTKLTCVTVTGGQHFLVSGSRDGALTVWRNAVGTAAGAAS